MHVCFVVESIFSFGGVQRVTAVIAKALVATAKVTIVTFDAPESCDTTLYGLDESHDIEYRFVAYPPVGAAKRHFCKAYSLLYRRELPQNDFTARLYAHSSFPSELRRVLIDELNRQPYDAIVGVHAPIATRLAAIKGSLHCKNLIGWVHNSFEAMFSPGSLYAGPELERYFVCQFRKLTHTVVLCHCDVEPYREKYGFTPTVVYNPLTLKPGAPSRGTSKKFLAVGRFSYQHKGFDLLIEAFAIFAKTDKEWTLDIVGEGPEENYFWQLICKHQLEARVKLHPFTNNIQAYYSGAQVYVLSSRWEGFGLVLVEAMAHGLPVVSSDLPTSQEIMGDFGLYFANGNVEQLARRLHDATRLDWPTKHEEAFQIARRFDIDTIVAQWQSLIHNS
jgi:glycosyltransferase involved in cell wall biosynthesis